MADDPRIAAPVDPTQGVLDQIKTAKSQGKPMTVDFGNIPGHLDSQQIVGALLDGLPPDKANALNAAAIGGHKATIDFGKLIPVQGEGSIYQDHPKLRALSKYVLRPALEMTGQGLGGAAGAALGTPEAPGIGTIAGGYAGKVAGGVAGDEIANKADEMMGLSHPEWRAPTSTAKRLGEETLGNAAMVGTGALTDKFIGRAMAPFADEVNVPVKQAAEELNIPLTAAQQSNSKLLAQAEQATAKLPVSSGILSSFYNRTRDRMVNIANSLFGKQTNPQIAGQIGDAINQQLEQKTNQLAQSGITPQLDPADVGQSLASEISGNTQEVSGKLSDGFEGLKQRAPLEPFVPESSMQQAKKVAENVGGIPPAMRNPQLGSVLKKLGAAVEDEVPGGPGGELRDVPMTPQLAEALGKAGGAPPAPKPPTFTVPELMEMRSVVGRAAAQHDAALGTQQPGTKFMGDKAGGAFKSLIGAIDDDIQSATEGSGFAEEYANLRNAWHEATNTMRNPYLRRILSTREPEKIVDLAITRGGVSNLQVLQKMVSPETYEQLGNAFQNKLIESSQNADGQFVPQKLSQLIRQYGEPTIQQVLGEDGLNNLKRLSNLSGDSFADPEFRNFVSALGKKNGENVTGLLMGASPQNINRVRVLIGEPAFSEAQDGIIHHLLTNNQGHIDFGGLGERLAQVPPESLAASLPAGKIAILSKLATVGGGIKASQREFVNASGTAPMMGTFFILRQLFTHPMAAVKVLASIATAAEGYGSKAATKYLTEGIPGAETAAKVGSGLARYPVSLGAQALENPYRKKQ